MFKLESKRLKREFKIEGERFYASQILNKYSDMSFVPDGNGCEFVVHFEDGAEFSSKGLPVVSSREENKKLRFKFAENMGVSVTLDFWIHKDGNTICKQLTLDQSDERVIDFVLLENIGIVNSQTHFGVEREDGAQIPCEWAALGQPFYIDSLFFGCEFPGSDNRIIYGTGRVKYYIGSAVGKNYECPVTVIGGAKDNSLVEVKKAFEEYLETIIINNEPAYTYNSWFDKLSKISADSIAETFSEVAAKFSEYGIAPPLSYVIDEGWSDYKADFWKENKLFAGRMSELAELCEKNGSRLGLWLSPRGGYSKNKKFAKHIQKAGNGFLSNTCDEICVASGKYTEKLGDFIIQATEEYNLSCWKIDGFALKPCSDESHDHLIGGKYDMYYVSDMWRKWVALFKKLRSRSGACEKLWINMTSYANPSPWWLQWVNSLWIQNSADIAFAENLENQPRVEAEITYRDSRYYDLFCERSIQLPLYAVYNHEPIYAREADTQYTDEEFEKYILWCAVRGQTFSELYLSPDMMSENKWKALKRSLDFQRDNFETLRHTQFIGGDPEENNVYGYVSWTESSGIVALRNPDCEAVSLTLTLNRLMGVKEDMQSFRCEYFYPAPKGLEDVFYSYNDKLDIKLKPFETIILKFTK